MQIEIRLLNDFYDIRHQKIKSRTSCTLQMEHAEHVYEVLENMMSELSQENSKAWKKDSETSEAPYYKIVGKEEEELKADNIWIDDEAPF